VKHRGNFTFTLTFYHLIIIIITIYVQGLGQTCSKLHLCLIFVLQYLCFLFVINHLFWLSFWVSFCLNVMSSSVCKWIREVAMKFSNLLYCIRTSILTGYWERSPSKYFPCSAMHLAQWCCHCWKHFETSVVEQLSVPPSHFLDVFNILKSSSL
jgi:hypothetical protein